MTNNIKVKIILSILLAIMISGLTYSYLKSNNADTKVVVAIQDIPEHVWINDNMIKEVSIRNHERVVLASDSITSKASLLYAISKNKIEKGKPINNQDVFKGSKEYLRSIHIIREDDQVNLSYFITNNKRIVAVKVDEQGSVNFMLKSGDYVDVIYTSGDGEGSFSSTILKHIEVHDVQEVLEKDKKNSLSGQNVLLLVSPQQAVVLNYAKRTGKIDLSLNPQNGDDEMISPVTLKNLLKP